MKISRTKSKKELISWVYNQAKNGLSEDEILKTLKLSLDKCA